MSRLMLIVIYFRDPLSNGDSNEKVLKSLKEVGLPKSEKKLHPYFSGYLGRSLFEAGEAYSGAQHRLCILVLLLRKHQVRAIS